MSSGRGIMTIAFGAEEYKAQAVSLALSLRRHYPEVPRAIVTDDPAHEVRNHYDVVIRMDPAWGANMTQKLHLIDYTPFERTLYIDGDCLVVRDLGFLWDLFAKAPFGVIGEQNRLSGQWLGAELADVRARLGIAAAIPAFNGGVLYFDTSSEARAVFHRALELADTYDDLGFGNAGGARWHMSDEPLFGLAMAEVGLAASDDGGAGMRTMIGMRGRLVLDVLAGRCRFDKAGVVVKPAIVHFAGQYTRSSYYRREQARLRWALRPTRRAALLRSAAGRRVSDVPLAVSAVAQQQARAAAKKVLRALPSSRRG